MKIKSNPFELSYDDVSNYLFRAEMRAKKIFKEGDPVPEKAVMKEQLVDLLNEHIDKIYRETIRIAMDAIEAHKTADDIL